MSAFDLFSIGHSNIPAERFVAMLRAANVGVIADVRSTPASRFCPWFSAKTLAPALAREGIDYLFYGDVLGGRPRDQNLYCDGIADYEAMARQLEFQAAIERLLADASHHTEGGLCLMCAERDPLDCHRCLLVARAVAGRGMTIGHILHDGRIEPHTAIEKRLLELANKECDLFATGQDGQLTAAYRCRARAVAYRAKGARVMRTSR
jgi:uncharacterized protein (DUF488 family)